MTPTFALPPGVGSAVGPDGEGGGWEPMLEERGAWGAKVALRGAASGREVRCRRCTLPLLAPPGCEREGIRQLIAFPCGHAFHVRCLPEEGCIICYHARRPLLPTIH